MVEKMVTIIFRSSEKKHLQYKKSLLIVTTLQFITALKTNLSFTNAATRKTVLKTWLAQQEGR